MAAVGTTGRMAKHAAAAELRVLQRQIEGYRRTFGVLVKRYGLSGFSVERVDDGFGEVHSGIEDMLPGLPE